MPITKSEVSKTLELDLTGVPEADMEAAKQEVADYLLDQVLTDIADQKSSVSGKPWDKLSPEYKAIKSSKSSSPVANLELTGAMLDSLDARPANGDAVEILITSSSQAPKAYNHNVGDTLPKRQFIPEETQSFRPGIMNEIEAIIDGFRIEDEEEDVDIYDDTKPTAPIIPTTPTSELSFLDSEFGFEPEL